MPAKHLMIVQGGGPTAVFNASLAAAIEGAQRAIGIGSVYGARFGLQGLVRSDVLDLTSATTAELEQLRHTPGAALGSSRHNPTEAEMSALPQTFARLGVGFVVFMGGNGTMRGARLVGALCRDAGIDVAVIGVPKTIDNDLGTTDRCPGYASAARYAAISTRDLAADIRSLPQPVSILETLGRNVGWVAAATALARPALADDSHAPHLVYISEVPFAEESFLERVHATVRKLGWAVVTVAEGIRHADGSLVYQTSAPGQADPLNRPMTGGVARHLATLVSEQLGIRCRCEIPGLLGRASIAHVAARDLEDATVVGKHAIAALAAGHRDVIVSLDPVTPDGQSTTSLLALEQASGEERCIPDDWLCDGDIPVNQHFFDYVQPLVGSLPPHLTHLGVPVAQ